MREDFVDPRSGASDDERVVEAGLRPTALAEFVGQRELKEHLHIVLGVSHWANMFWQYSQLKKFLHNALAKIWTSFANVLLTPLDHIGPVP